MWMIFGGLGRFTVFEVFQSREQGGLTSASADRLIEYFIVAGLICVSYQFLFGTLFHPAAAEAPVVMACSFGAYYRCSRPPFLVILHLFTTPTLPSAINRAAIVALARLACGPVIRSRGCRFAPSPAAGGIALDLSPNRCSAPRPV
jgi:hypothetical protein